MRDTCLNPAKPGPRRPIIIQVIEACLLAAALSCSGGEAESPREQCEVLFDVLCGRVGECFNARNALEDSTLVQELCIERLQGAGFCESAVGVRPSYDRCIDALGDLDCDQLFGEDNELSDDFSLPNTCENVILVSQ